MAIFTNDTATKDFSDFASFNERLMCFVLSAFNLLLICLSCRNFNYIR